MNIIVRRNVTSFNTDKAFVQAFKDRVRGIMDVRPSVINQGHYTQDE